MHPTLPAENRFQADCSAARSERRSSAISDVRRRGAEHGEVGALQHGDHAVIARTTCDRRPRRRPSIQLAAPTATTIAADAGEPLRRAPRRVAGSASGDEPPAGADDVVEPGAHAVALHLACTNSSPACGEPASTMPSVMAGNGGTSVRLPSYAGDEGLRRAPRPPRGRRRRSARPSRSRGRSPPACSGRARARRCRAGVSGARSRSTRSSFHARLAASRKPAHRPWPANGGVWWAASPARSTRPRRHSSDPTGLEPVHRVLLEAGVVGPSVERLEQAPGRRLVVQLIDRTLRAAP